MENGDFRPQPKGFATKAIHSGQSASQWNSRCVVPPIVMSTTFKQDAPSEHRGFEYGRSGNPTRNVLEACLAALDNGKYGLAFSSGLGAITTLLSLLKTGDHMILSDDVYGGTGRLIRNLAAQFGISSTFVDATDINNIKKAVTKDTKVFFIETPTNPLLKIVDIQQVSDMAKEYKDRNIIVVVDNTFLSPYFQRPLDLGADISLYSLTKYMNGHSDVIMGAMIVNCPDLHSRLRFMQNAAGIIPSPFDCYLVNRSLKTLSIRMQQHAKNSIAVAKYLEKHPFVESVIHPGLKSHPQYELVRKQSYGHSGVMSFYIKGGLEESRKFLKALKVFTLAESLGGYESLAELPSVMTHASVPVEERERLRISDSLIRLSVGLEDVEDLIDDLDFALKIAQS